MNVINFQDANCAHCYKCLRHCEVKAIRVKNGQAQIVRDMCIYCGHCMEICPQNAKTLESDLAYVKSMLYRKERVIVSLDPSFTGLLHVEEPGRVIAALKKLGFSEIRETAEGAALVTEEYVKLMESGTMDNIIATDCPGVVYLVEKHYPMLIPYLAPVVSPMIAHGKMLRQMYGDDVKIVFIGPCVTKKMEAEVDPRTRGIIDAVIEFNELEQWLQEKNIVIADCELEPFVNPDPMVNRLNPITNGVCRAVDVYGGNPKYKRLMIGSIPSCREFLHSMKRGYIHNCFVEIRLCTGGCVNGPGVNKRRGFRFKATMNIENEARLEKPVIENNLDPDALKRSYTPKQVVEKIPSEEEIKAILKTIGKSGSDVEFNCGACGYLTCREKAIAIYQGRAEAQMCLIRTYDNARSQANMILDSMPNLLFILDKDFRIREINKKGEEVLKMNRQQALRTYLFEVVEDISNVEAVYHTHESRTRVKADWNLYNMAVLETAVYIPENDRVLLIVEDATEEKKNAERQLEEKLETVRIAQSVIDKQMTTAQQIAELLGETTAETKSILTTLRDSILDNAFGPSNNKENER